MLIPQPEQIREDSVRSATRRPRVQEALTVRDIAGMPIPTTQRLQERRPAGIATRTHPDSRARGVTVVIAMTRPAAAIHGAAAQEAD